MACLVRGGSGPDLSTTCCDSCDGTLFSTPSSRVTAFLRDVSARPRLQPRGRASRFLRPRVVRFTPWLQWMGSPFLNRFWAVRKQDNHGPSIYPGTMAPPWSRRSECSVHPTQRTTALEPPCHHRPTGPPAHRPPAGALHFSAPAGCMGTLGHLKIMVCGASSIFRNAALSRVDCCFCVAMSIFRNAALSFSVASSILKWHSGVPR